MARWRRVWVRAPRGGRRGRRGEFVAQSIGDVCVVAGLHREGRGRARDPGGGAGAVEVDALLASQRLDADDPG